MTESSNNSHERRIYQRFDLKLPLNISGKDFEFKTQTKNISCAGVYCQINRFMPVMTKVEITMFIPLLGRGRKTQKRIKCLCVVVRIEPEHEQRMETSYHLGLFFTKISEKERNLISEYIQQAFFAGNN